MSAKKHRSIVISALAVAGVGAISLVFWSTRKPGEAATETARPPDSTAAGPAAPGQRDSADDAGTLDEDILELLGDDLTSLVPAKTRAAADKVLRPPQRRANQQIAVLKNESLNQSLANLFDVEMFTWPGAPGGGFDSVTKPLDSISGWHEVHTVMSNRRVVKIMQELAALAPRQAGGMLTVEIDKSLEEYKKVLGAYLEKHKERFAPGVRLEGLGFYAGNNPDGTPTLMGIRWKMLSLVFVAGQLNLQEAMPAVLEVADYTVAQRAAFYDERRYSEFAGPLLLIRASLYNRQILAAALAGAGPRSQAFREVVERTGLQWQTKALTSYDALATPYDLRARFGEVAVDYSAGKRTVRFPREVSDDQFDAVLAGAR